VSQVRGQVKTKVRLHSESGYKLESSTDLVKIRKTRERVEDLKDRMAFAYKVQSFDSFFIMAPDASYIVAKEPVIEKGHLREPDHPEGRQLSLVQ
jgi:Domain of unknown function (DUF6532)